LLQFLSSLKSGWLPGSNVRSRLGTRSALVIYAL